MLVSIAHGVDQLNAECVPVGFSVLNERLFNTANFGLNRGKSSIVQFDQGLDRCRAQVTLEVEPRFHHFLSYRPDSGAIALQTPP